MDFTGLTLTKIDAQSIIKPFDCGDIDLNEFLVSKAVHYKKELLAVTYLLENENRTIAFFSVFNDRVRISEDDFASKNAFKKFLKGFVSHPKRHLRDYPALKIGRLGVCNQIQKGGIGKAIIDFIINLAVKQNNYCACKLLIVDAYVQSLGFYERKGFQYLADKNNSMNTREMYLDLTPYYLDKASIPVILHAN